MFCGKCGCQNSENARFCRKCGKPIRQGTPAMSYCTPHKVYVPALEKAKSESRKKTWLIVRLIYWAACTISIFIGLLFYNPTVQQDMPNRVFTEKGAEYFSGVLGGGDLNTSWEPVNTYCFTFFGHQYLQVRERKGEKTQYEVQPKVIVGSALLYAGLYLLPVVVTIVVKVNSKNSGKRQSFS